MPLSPAPEEGGWLDDPLVPESTDAVTLREDERGREPPARVPARSTPDPSSSLVEAAAPTAPRTARSIAPPGATPSNSLRAVDRSAFSTPPKAPAPFMPSQMPPPLIHDPRATRKRSAPPPAGQHFNRGVVRGVVVSLGLVAASAAIAILVLRNRQADDAPAAPAAARAETIAPAVVETAPAAAAASVVAPPAGEAAPSAAETPAETATETAAAVADSAAPSASAGPPDPAAPAAPPVTAAVAPPPSVPFGGVHSAPKSSRHSSKKPRSHFVPDDI